MSLCNMKYVWLPTPGSTTYTIIEGFYSLITTKNYFIKNGETVGATNIYNIYFDYGAGGGHTPGTPGTNTLSLTANSELASDNTYVDSGWTFTYSIKSLAITCDLHGQANDIGYSDYSIHAISGSGIAGPYTQFVHDWFSCNMKFRVINTNISQSRGIYIEVTRNSIIESTSFPIAIHNLETIDIPVILLHPPNNGDVFLFTLKQVW